ncbi:MAG: Hpt domain-containing protein [Moraxellaceae bacterium]|nr:Hpt domain-containing protein [Moraxellaceae bacterium]
MTVHIDNEQLAELKDVLEDEFGILISTYLADAKLRLQLIEQGLQNQDYDAVRLAAHSLKGASANLGAVILAQLCEKLEHDCKVVGSNFKSAWYVSAITEELNIVVTELQKSLT